MKFTNKVVEKSLSIQWNDGGGKIIDKLRYLMLLGLLASVGVFFAVVCKKKLR